MANVIRIKRRSSGAAGAPSSLKNAELAFNEVDSKLYYGVGADGSGNATSIIAIGGAGWDYTPDLSGYAPLAGATFTGDVNVGTSGTPRNLVVQGNLTVNGTTTTVNATTVEVADKNITLGVTYGPATDAGADGGGITLKGTTDKEFKWSDSTDAWTSSEHVALAAGKNVVISGSSSGKVTVAVPATAGTNTVTLPAATGTVALTNDKLSAFAATSSSELAGVISDETGTGALVFANTPTLVSPVLGTPTSGTLTNCSGLPVSTGVSGLGTDVATALAANVGSAGAIVVNGGVLGTPSSGTLTNCSGLPISTGVSGLGTSVASALANNVGSAGAIVVNGGALGTPSSGTLTSCTGLPISTGVSGLGTGVATALAVNTGSAGAVVLYDGALGTPSSGTLTSCTGLPISTGVSGLGTGVATFLGTPSSANLASAVTDETGSGSLVFATSPTLVTPTLGAASATSVNKVAITAPATSATLTIADGKTLTASNSLTFTGTDSSSVAFGAGGTVVYESTVCSAISNCSLDGGSF
jgi:hypothetical protein